MLSGEKILVTGVTGMVGFPVATALAPNNEVWGLARFATPSDRGHENVREMPDGTVRAPTTREAVEAAGITARAVDIGAADFSSLPDDFTYVLHFSWMRAPLAELDAAFRVNVVGPGRLFQHCRKAKGVLVVSSQGIYTPNDDPRHLYTETDPVGRGMTAYAQTSPATKLGLESVARFCAEAFDLPITIARLNTVLGPTKAYHGSHVRAILAGEPIIVPGEPNLHSPIHIDDIVGQTEALVEAASIPPVVTNWGGDDVVTTQETSAFAAKILAKPAKVVLREVAGAPKGNGNDATRRRSLTGLCAVGFYDGFRRVIADVVAEQAAGA